MPEAQESGGSHPERLFGPKDLARIATLAPSAGPLHAKRLSSRLERRVASGVEGPAVVGSANTAKAAFHPQALQHEGLSDCPDPLSSRPEPSVASGVEGPGVAGGRSGVQNALIRAMKIPSKGFHVLTIF